MKLTRRMALAGGAALPMAPAARAQELQKVSVAVIRLASSGPIFIALAKGWFREAGLDVATRDFQAAGQVPLAVVSGDTEFGVTAFTAGFFNLAAKGGLKVVAAQSAERPGYPLNGFAVTNKAWDAGVRTVKDFAGKRIGITTVGSSVHYSLERVARKHGVDPRTIEMPPLQTIPNMVAAFKGGQIDGMVTPASTWRLMEADAIRPGHLVSWVGDELPWQLGGLFVSPRLIVEKRATVEKFVAGYRKGAAAYHGAFGKREGGKIVAGPGYDVMLAILADAIKLAPHAILLALPYIDPEGRLDVGDIYEQVKFWQSIGQVQKDCDPKTFLDLGFVQGHMNVP